VRPLEWLAVLDARQREGEADQPVPVVCADDEAADPRISISDLRRG
jgi:hypothetical protein